MNRFLQLLIIAIFFTAHTFAQNGTIQKVYAFVQVVLPGTIMADENGRPMPPPLNIGRTIYVEVKGNVKPLIESVQYKNENFKVSITAAPHKVEAGINKNTGQKVDLLPAKGNTLWNIQLLGTDEKEIMKTAEPYKKIILIEKKNGRKIKFIIEKEIELQSPMSV